VRQYRYFALCFLVSPWFSQCEGIHDLPKIIAYQAAPNDYFNTEADRVAQIYDGFFFNIGAWDQGIPANIGILPATPSVTDWMDRVGENLIHLNEAGVTENLLGVSFSSEAPWPSPETLLSEGYREKMAAHFGSLGKAAKELGFRGVSIDLEYPYPRYELDHEIYTYDKYSVEDLLRSSRDQGRAVMSALLDGFPEAVVFVLPGTLWTRPIDREYLMGAIEAMAERDAPGGMHLGYERAYTLYEYPLTQVAIPRVGDLEAQVLLRGEMLDYWKRRCTVAPGVWPTHMVETGGKDYPQKPWKEELAELRNQMEILRTVAKRYIWSFSGQPLWYLHDSEVEERYGLKKQTLPGVDEIVPGWQAILTEKRKATDPKILELVEEVSRFDEGEITAGELCHRFGTPGEWLVLAPLGNPLTRPAFSQPNAIFGPIQKDLPYYGRDGAVPWVVFRPMEPLGSVSLRAALDWIDTDDCSAHLLATIEAPEKTEGLLQLGWDDGIVVRIGDRVVFDHPDYPEKGHGMLFRDRYLFERKIPVTIPEGKSRLAVTSLNLHGVWGFNMRFTDPEGFPLKGITFSLPAE